MIKWYRSPVGRETLAVLNQRSDLKAAVQAVGFLMLLTTTASATFFASGRAHWACVLALVFLHGTVYAFLRDGIHELAHDSVFRTRWLNRLFLRLFSFLDFYNPVNFWISHAEHHKHTLHRPDDLEVVLPVDVTLRGFLLTGFVDLDRLRETISASLRLSFNHLAGTWEHHLFETIAPNQRRWLCGWSRFMLLGHAAIVGVSLWRGLWMVPLLVTFAPFYGAWLFYLTNKPQHAGLHDHVSDFRLCTRTIILSPPLRFLYWSMNYHIEHHMYAAVPCYNLRKLHEKIRHDLPTCPRGLLATWKEIIAIRRRQLADPSYQYLPDVPGSPTG